MISRERPRATAPPVVGAPSPLRSAKLASTRRPPGRKSKTKKKIVIVRAASLSPSIPGAGPAGAGVSERIRAAPLHSGRLEVGGRSFGRLDSSLGVHFTNVPPPPR